MDPGPGNHGGFARGDTVQVHSLQKKKDLNGMYVRVVERVADRWRCIELDDSQTYTIKPGNLRPFRRLNVEVLYEEFHEYLKTTVDMNMGPEMLLDIQRTMDVEHLKAFKCTAFNFVCERLILRNQEKHPLVYRFHRNSNAVSGIKVMLFYPVKVYEDLAGIFDDYVKQHNPSTLVDVPIKYAWAMPNVSQYLRTNEKGQVGAEFKTLGTLQDWAQMVLQPSDSKQSEAARQEEMMALASLIGGMNGFNHTEIAEENRQFQTRQAKPQNMG